MIRFKDVNKWFGDNHVLQDINLHIQPGETVVVCGPSGSGKSTLIRCINQLEPIQKGEIFVDKIQVNKRATNLTQLRSQIGFVFQQFNLYPHLTVLENVVLSPIKVKKIARKKAEENARKLLERVGIPDKADDTPLSFPAVSASGLPSRGGWR